MTSVRFTEIGRVGVKSKAKKRTRLAETNTRPPENKMNYNNSNTI